MWAPKDQSAALFPLGSYVVLKYCPDKKENKEKLIELRSLREQSYIKFCLVLNCKKQTPRSH